MAEGSAHFAKFKEAFVAASALVVAAPPAAQPPEGPRPLLGNGGGGIIEEEMAAGGLVRNAANRASAVYAPYGGKSDGAKQLG